MRKRMKRFRTTMTLTVVLLMIAAVLIALLYRIFDNTTTNPTTPTTPGSTDNTSKNPSSPTTDDDTSSSKDDKTYTVTKEETKNGSLDLTPESVKVGEKFSAKITPDEGYSVSAYIIDGVSYEVTDVEKGQPYYVDDLVMKEGGTTIGATFVANTYTVTLLDMEKGKSFDSFTATYDSTFTLPTTHADVIGYTVGWKDTESNRYESGQTWKVAKDITLYATWTYDTYRMTLNPDGGTLINI